MQTNKDEFDNLNQKKWNKAPLPFQGQKRNFIKQFKEILKQTSPKIIVDVFGGSGLLARIAKDEKSSAKVIYNDFDNYSERLKNIEDTNKIRNWLEQFLSGYKYVEKIKKEDKKQILAFLDSTPLFIDYETIGTWLLFSGNRASSFEKLKKKTFYNRIIKSDIDCADYLKDLEVCSCDFIDLINQYKDEKDVLFLIDPPYTNTEQKYSCNALYFTFFQQVNLLEKMKEMNQFIYFSSDKSDVGKGYLQKVKCNLIKIFDCAKLMTQKNGINYSNSYLDMMIYKV